MSKLPIPRRLGEAVYKRDGKLCFACKHLSATEIHHIIPEVIGGETIITNLVALCHICHFYVPFDNDKKICEQKFIQYCSHGGFVGLLLHDGLYLIKDIKRFFIKYSQKKAEKGFLKIKNSKTPDYVYPKIAIANLKRSNQRLLEIIISIDIKDINYKKNINYYEEEIIKNNLKIKEIEKQIIKQNQINNIGLEAQLEVQAASNGSVGGSNPPKPTEYDRKKN